MPDGELFEAIYVQRMDGAEELERFFRENQEWNLAPQCITSSDLRTIHESGLHVKPVFVQGDDGVVYAGTANGSPHHGGFERSPAILMRFVIGKNQETDSIDKKMRELEFQNQGGRYIHDE